MGSCGKVRSTEGLERDEQGLGRGTKEMTLQREPKGLGSWRSLNIAGVMALPMVEGRHGVCARKTRPQLGVCQ